MAESMSQTFLLGSYIDTRKAGGSETGKVPGIPSPCNKPIHRSSKQIIQCLCTWRYLNSPGLDVQSFRSIRETNLCPEQDNPNQCNQKGFCRGTDKLSGRVSFRGESVCSQDACIFLFGDALQVYT
ncbi:PREDICTED: uncharacterized protein LOC107354554 [Acropora digitifera]|uniref:uncharacterized protein LOC107354554 n=1 Tax=Acropora digitifera TaxID=70779 RepID=UPI00077A7B92|nr:PREDICTED: uncharacterized protein LOC107354554 [Acropora digitifera]